MLCKPRVGLRKRVARTLHDRVDRAARKPATEQLADELDCVPAGDAVSDCEGGDGSLQARTEGAASHPGRKLGASLAGARFAAHPVQAVLGDRDGDRRQLEELVALGRSRVEALLRAQLARAVGAALGPVLHELVDPLEFEQRPVPAFVTGLAAAASSRGWLLRPGWRRGRILRGRQ